MLPYKIEDFLTKCIQAELIGNNLDVISDRRLIRLVHPPSAVDQRTANNFDKLDRQEESFLLRLDELSNLSKYPKLPHIWDSGEKVLVAFRLGPENNRPVDWVQSAPGQVGQRYLHLGSAETKMVPENIFAFANQSIDTE